MAALRDMTKGSPLKIMLGFTIPVFIGNVFQQLYSMVDTVIVGKFVGTGALAAVGSTGTVMFLILGFLMGFTTGITVITSQRFGAGDMKGVKRSVSNAAMLSVIISILMTALSLIFMRPLLQLMNTPEDIFADAYSYITVICAGICMQVLYNTLSAMLRAIGNSKAPLYFLILSALLNIVLDLVFIIFFKMGTAGAAWATVISQGASGIACLVYIIKYVPVLRPGKGNWKLDRHIVTNQIRVGIPMALQFSITAIGSIIMQSCLNIFGSVTVAAFTAASKVEQLATQAFMAIGTCMATYCAQNTGARDIKRLKRGYFIGTVSGCVYAVVVGVGLIFFGKYLAALFVSDNLDEITGLVDTYMKCVGGFFIPLNFIFIFRNGLQGMGYGFLPMTAGIAELIGRGIVAVIGAKLGSYLIVCLSHAAAWICAGLLLLVLYIVIIRRIEKGTLNSANFRHI